MKVPLTIFPMNDNKVAIYSNKGNIKINFPFKPRIYIENGKIPSIEGRTEKWIKVPENEEREYIKAEFANLKEFSDFRAKYSDYNIHTLTTNYKEQIYIYEPDFITKYQQTEPLIVMFYDIETVTRGDGLFSDALRDPILMIGYSIWKYNNDGSKKKIAHKICEKFDLESMDDTNVINEWLDDIKYWDPDIISDYNGSNFDLPYIAKRCGLLGINTSKIGRAAHEITIRELENTVVRIPGRIHFDMYNSNSGVVKDQTLFGIKGHTLKHLARWYNAKRTNIDGTTEKMEDIELEGDIKNTLKLMRENPDRLRAYLNDDIYRTESVGNVYIRNSTTLADIMKVPLDDVMNMYSSFIPKLLMMRKMYNRRLINTASNFRRYNSLDGIIKKIGNSYQGAITGIYKVGYFPATWKLDYSSQYPSAIITWNIGVDTVQFMGLKEYTGKYQCIDKGKYKWYRFPSEFDKGKIKYDIVVRVDNTKESFLRKTLLDLKNERSKIKKELKSAKGNEKAKLNSQQVAIKVIMNSIYGVLGTGSSKCGDMICAAMVTSMSRWSIIRCMQKNKNCLIETDSVTSDTPIYILNKITNEIDIIPIEDLHNGKKKREPYDGKYNILTRNGWKSINYTKKHKISKNIHRVKISNGYVDVTEDHSLFDINKKPIKPTKILTHKSEIETKEKLKINIKKYNNLLENEEFCWLIGFFIAEGSASECKSKRGLMKRQISFNGNNLLLMRKVEKLANKYLSKIAVNDDKLKKRHKFKLHDTIKSSSVYKVQGGYNKNAVDWFKKFCYTKNRRDKKVPIFILNGNNKMKNAFMKGLMDGDGYISINNNRKVESIDSKFKSLSAGISFIWNSLDFKTTCSIRKDKNNITTYKKRFPYRNGIFRCINSNLVTINKLLNKNDNIYVYDISTSDGTFVTALGDIVLHNTDGIIVDKKLDPDKENKFIKDEVKKKFNIDNNMMMLDVEGNGERAYFYRKKNYIVEDTPGEYTKHGVSMKSSKLSNIADRAINLGIEYIFNNKPAEEVVSEAYNFKNVSIKDFTEKKSIRKDLNSYDDPTNTTCFLAKQVEMKKQKKVVKGETIEYVVAKNPLPQKEFRKFNKGTNNYIYVELIDSIDELDLKYYEKVVDRILERFGISRINTLQTNMFGDSGNKKKPLTNIKLDKIPEEEI